MKKLFIFCLILVLPLAVFAAPKYPDLDNIIIEAGQGANPTAPPTTVRLCRFGRAGGGDIPGISSGTVVGFDVNSKDGISILSYDPSTEKISGNVVGVLVTDIETDNDGAMETTPGDNWGYMAVKGYCLASIDAAMPAGTLLGPSVYAGALGRAKVPVGVPESTNQVSRVVGILIEDSKAGKMGEVYLFGM